MGGLIGELEESTVKELNWKRVQFKSIVCEYSLKIH